VDSVGAIGVLGDVFEVSVFAVAGVIQVDGAQVFNH
jgi:hypothetical protein